MHDDDVADAAFDEHADYVLAVTLPDLCQRPVRALDAYEQFTESDARRLPLIGLPVEVKHDDRTDDFVGVIDAAGVARLDHYALVRVVPAVSAHASAASKHIANGTYRAVSLSHRFGSVRASAASASGPVKLPFELSFVERPWRAGADVRCVWPSRTSLAGYSRATLAKLAARYYADELASGRLAPVPDEHCAPADLAKYKDAFADVVRHQRTQVLRALPLSRVNPVDPAEFMASLAATTDQPPTRASADAQAPPAAAEPPAAAADAQQQQQVSTLPPLDLKDAKATAARVLEVEARMRELEARNAELAMYEERVKREEAERRAALDAKATATFEALMQYMEKTYSPDVVAEQAKALRAQIDANPLSAIAFMEQQKDMLVRASDAEAANNKRAAELAAREKELEDELHWKTLDAQRAALMGMPATRASSALAAPDTASSSSSALGSSMTKRFVLDAPAPATPASSTHERDVSTSSAGVSSPPPVAPADQTMAEASRAKRSAPEVRASADDEPWGVRAYADAVEALRLQGIMSEPTIDQIELGLHAFPTGKVRAGANGVKEVVMATALAHNAPARHQVDASYKGPLRRELDMRSFAPDTWAQMMRMAAGVKPQAMHNMGAIATSPFDAQPYDVMLG